MTTSRSLLSSSVFSVFSVVNPLAAEPGPWATYRGNPQRTGNTDNKAGPEKPAVLWAVKSQDHFVASPVPVKDGVLRRRARRVQPADRRRCSRSPRRTRRSRRGRSQPRTSSSRRSARRRSRATTSSSATACTRTPAACCTASTRRPASRSGNSPLPGDLIHLEGAPASPAARSSSAAGRRACSASNSTRPRSTARTTTSPTIAKMQDEKWKELQAKYEEAKEEGRLRDPAGRQPAAQVRPEEGVAEGRGEVARGCPGEPRGRQGARADVVPRQGEGRRAGALRLNADDRRDGVEGAS